MSPGKTPPYGMSYAQTARKQAQQSTVPIGHWGKKFSKGQPEIREVISPSPNYNTNDSIDNIDNQTMKLTTKQESQTITTHDNDKKNNTWYVKHNQSKL